MSIPLKKSESYRIFDAIAPRYDFVNSVLSFGLHHVWRREIRRQLPKERQRVLDLATGTGDVALELAKCVRIEKISGLDMSEEMLVVGREKVRQQKLDHRIDLVAGNAQSIPFADGTFNATTMSFGIRNVPDPLACLKDCYRVLKPGGRTLVMEFGLPRSALVRWGHLTYLRHVLPKLGNFLTGHDFAYSYLNKTIEDFPYGDDFLSLMRKAGFSRVGYKPLTFGVVNLYWGDKN